MTILTFDKHITVGLPALSVLVVQASGSGSVVRLANQPGGEPYSPIAVVSGDQKNIGPFPVHTRHRIECSSGSLDYVISQADFPAVESDVSRIVRITQAAYDGLASPVDDTLYVIVG